MAHLFDRWGIIKDVPGDWVPADYCSGELLECPECGADEGQQCNFCPEGEDYAIEVSTHIHAARLEEP